MKKILKTVFVIIGTMIGAGFASGQEICLFFNQYGNIGILGMIIACTLSGIISYQVFCILQKENLNTYTQLLEKISSKKILNQAISIIISIFLLISFYIMVAGMSAYFNQAFGFPTIICSVIMSVICYITLKKDMKGIVIVNTILIPCIIIFILYLGLQNMEFSINYLKNTPMLSSVNGNWFISSILYASYNSILLIPILVELKQYMENKTMAKKACVICTLVLTILGVLLFCLLLKDTNAYKLELPMIEIVKKYGSIYEYFYGAVVVVAIFTSAISAGYGFLKNQVAKKDVKKGDKVKREQSYYNKLLLIMCTLAPIIANFGFSALVSKLYPMFGILGLLQIAGIFMCNFSKGKVA